MGHNTKNSHVVFLRKSLMSLHMIIQYLRLIATKKRHPTKSATIDNETIIAARRKSLPLFAGLYCSQKSKTLGYSHRNTRGEEGTRQNLNTHNSIDLLDNERQNEFLATFRA